MIITVKKSDIAKTAMYINTGKLTVAQVREKTGADIVVNGGLYDPITSALASGGKTYKASQTYGYALGTAPIWTWMNNVGADEYIGAYPALVRNGEVLRDGWPKELEGSTRRTCVGLTADGDMVICCGVAATMDGIAAVMLASGCVSAINLDGGGSSQMICPEGTVKSSDAGGERIVHNLICVWLIKSAMKPDADKQTITATATALTPTLDSSGLVEKGRYIDAGDVCEISREITDRLLFRVTYPVAAGTRTAYLKSLEGFTVRTNDLPIHVDLIPQGNVNRPGGKNSCEFITIHNTDNASRGADAAAHAKYLKDGGALDKVSWHYTVDDGAIYQHLPDTETAWHTGTNAGNTRSVGIEICENADGDIMAATDLAARLTARLLKAHGLCVAKVRQHHDWNGKDCPSKIRAGIPYNWDTFITKVEGFM